MQDTSVRRPWPIDAIALAAVLLALPSVARSQSVALSEPPVAPLELAHPGGGHGTPVTLTLADAIARSSRNDAQFQAVRSDADLAREDRIQAGAAMLPALSATTQFLGNSANGVNPNGRFVSMDGVRMYRAWGVLHEDLSANTLTLAPLRRAQATELAAAARVETAQRGLAVTVTRVYYALAAAQRKYATAQLATQQAARFLEITQRQQRLGQVARSDAVKAELAFELQQNTFREAQLAMENARLALAVLVSPVLDEDFTIVDDATSGPALPPFTDVRALAEQHNPDVRAATASLDAAGRDVTVSRNAFLPTLTVDAAYGIEANEFALHSRIAAQPELGVLPNLGSSLTLNLQVPVWDWGGLRSKLRQSHTRQRQAQTALTQTQRQVLGNVYSMYNEALTARAAAERLQRAADLAAESLRLTTLRYEAGESTALEVVDAQNTLVAARNAVDDATTRYRVAIADLQTVTGPF